MKGLFYKDVYTMVKQYRFMLLVVIVFGLIPGNSLSFLAVVYAAILPVSALAADEQAGWTRLAAALPVPRRQIVFSKYLLGLVCAVAAAALALIGEGALALARGQGYGLANLANAWGMMGLGLFLQSLSLPMMFKFGVEKGRLCMMLVMALAVGAVTAINVAAPQDLAGALTSPAILGFIALPVLALSIICSIRIFEKREL